ncbi:FAFR235Cp [Eremothecium gossypii FDAG1]|nr:FAFR235Cp [Eremothecium gossypii FDAG1]
MNAEQGDFVDDSQDEDDQIIPVGLSESDASEVHNMINSDLSDAISSLDDERDSDWENGTGEEFENSVANDPILNKVISSRVHESTPVPPIDREVGAREATLEQIRASQMREQIDRSLIDNIEKLERLQKQINSSPEKPWLRSTDVVEERRQAISAKIVNPVPKRLLEYLARDRVGSNKDWYFLTHNAIYQEPTLTELFLGSRPLLSIRDLYLQFGASEDALDAEFKILECNSYEQLNNRAPLELMCYEIERHIPFSANDQLELSLRYFILFILDRKVFDCVELDTEWCATLWEKHKAIDRIAVYLSVVPKDCYFLHYRATRLLPLKDELLCKLFIGSQPQEVIKQFDTLLENDDWFQILYFMLLVNGLPDYPLGGIRIWQYFKDRIYDMNIDNVSSIELSLLKSYVNMCTSYK